MTDEQLRQMAPENNHGAWTAWAAARRAAGQSPREIAAEAHRLAAEGVPLESMAWMDGRIAKAFADDPRVHRWRIANGQEDHVLDDRSSFNPPTDDDRRLALESLRAKSQDLLRQAPEQLLTRKNSVGRYVLYSVRHRDPEVRSWAHETRHAAEDAAADKLVSEAERLNDFPRDSYAYRHYVPLSDAMTRMRQQVGVYGDGEVSDEFRRLVNNGLLRHPKAYDTLIAAGDNGDQYSWSRLIPEIKHPPTPQQHARLLESENLLVRNAFFRQDGIDKALPYVKNKIAVYDRLRHFQPDVLGKEHFLEAAREGWHAHDLFRHGVESGKLSVDDLAQLLVGDDPELRHHALEVETGRRLHAGAEYERHSPLEGRHLEEALPHVLGDLDSGREDTAGSLASHEKLDPGLADLLYDHLRQRLPHTSDSPLLSLTNNASVGPTTISKIVSDHALPLEVRQRAVAHPNSSREHEELALRHPVLYQALAAKEGVDPENLRRLYERHKAGEDGATHVAIHPMWANPNTPTDVIDDYVKTILPSVKQMSDGRQHRTLKDRLLTVPSEHWEKVYQQAQDLNQIIKNPAAGPAALVAIDRQVPHLITSAYDREELQNRLSLETPDFYQRAGEEPTRVRVKVGSARFRRARDHILASGKAQLPPRMMPPGEWGVGRTPSGDISAENLDAHVRKMPELRFNVTSGKWGSKIQIDREERAARRRYQAQSGAFLGVQVDDDVRRHRLGEQRHSGAISRVFQLNLTDDHVRQMRQAGVFDTFKKVYRASKFSNHPVGPAGIGWVRWTANPQGRHGAANAGIFVDEVQSDLGGFGRSLASQARANARKQADEQGLTPEQAADHEEAAVRSAREKFDAEFPPNHLATINSIVFGGHKPNEVILEAFHQRMRDKGYHDAVVHIHSVASKKKQLTDANYFEEGDVPAHFQHTYEQLPKKMGMQPAKYGELPTESNEDMKGLPVWSAPVRKSESDFVSVLGKSERRKSVVDVSSVAVFDPRGRLLFGKRSDNNKWTLPGGHAEPNEDPDDCARRELKEETGIDLPAGRFDFLGVGLVDGYEIHSYAVYLKAAEVKDAPHGRQDPDEECSEWKFFAVREGLPEEVRDNLHSPRNVTLALVGLGSPEGIDFGVGLTVSETNDGLVVPGADDEMKKSFSELAQSRRQLEPHVWDYSHLLPQNHRQHLKLTVSEEHPDIPEEVEVEHWEREPVVMARLSVIPGSPVRQSVDRDIVGYLGGRCRGRHGISVAKECSTSAYVHPQLRGQGLGKALYTALFAHAAVSGRPNVSGSWHSPDASRVHRSLSRDHAVDYDSRNVDDEIFSPWSYTLKMEKSEVDDLLQHPDPLERSLALRSEGVGARHLVRALHDPDPRVRTAARQHPGTDSTVLLGFMAAPAHARQEQLEVLRDHPAVTPDHVRALVGFVARDPNGEPPETVRTLAQHPMLDEDGARCLWDLADQGTRMLLVGHPACPVDLRAGVVQDELRQPLGASSAALAIEALAHPLPAALRAAVLRSERPELVSALAGAPDLEPELVDDVLRLGLVPTEPDEWADARVKVLSGRNVLKRHLDTALEDRHPEVCRAVFSSPSSELSRAHVLRALARGEPELVAAALRSRVGGVA